MVKLDELPDEVKPMARSLLDEMAALRAELAREAVESGKQDIQKDIDEVVEDLKELGLTELPVA